MPTLLFAESTNKVFVSTVKSPPTLNEETLAVPVRPNQLTLAANVADATLPDTRLPAIEEAVLAWVAKVELADRFTQADP
jgi:hypothetical protein